LFSSFVFSAGVRVVGSTAGWNLVRADAQIPTDYRDSNGNGKQDWNLKGSSHIRDPSGKDFAIDPSGYLYRATAGGLAFGENLGRVDRAYLQTQPASISDLIKEIPMDTTPRDIKSYHSSMKIQFDSLDPI